MLCFDAKLFLCTFGMNISFLMFHLINVTNGEYIKITIDVT